MATLLQRQNFARETIEDARALRDVMRRIEARSERWNALSLSEQAFEQTDFTDVSGIEHLTPAALTAVITTINAALAEIETGHMGNLDRAIP